MKKLTKRELTVDKILSMMLYGFDDTIPKYEVEELVEYLSRKRKTLNSIDVNVKSLLYKCYKQELELFKPTFDERLLDWYKKVQKLPLEVLQPAFTSIRLLKFIKG